MAKQDARITALLGVLEQAYGKRGWHGPTLRGALRGVTPKQALWKPSPGRNSIWELVLHTAYWKYAVRRRLAGDAVGSFPRAPSNFPAVPKRPDAKRWRDDVRLLDAQHRALVAMVKRLRPADLSARTPRKTWTNLEQLFGVALHDVYHTGQIGLLKRLCG